jgi:hypothetical protein
MGMMAIQFDRFRAALNEHIFTGWPDNRVHHALLIFGTLLHIAGDATDAKKRAKQVVDRATILHLSTIEKRHLTGMIAHYQQAQVLDVQSPLAIHRYWYQLDEIGIDACLLGLASYLATYGNELQQDDWLVQIERALVLLDAYFNQYETLVSPPLLLNGHDLMQALDLEAGPLIGELLSMIRKGQVTGAITSRDDALVAAKAYLNNDTHT